MGVTLALPLLDAMLPAQTLLKKTAAAGSPRMGFVYVPHGAIMDQWTPEAEGAGFEFSPNTEAAGAVPGSLECRERTG